MTSVENSFKEIAKATNGRYTNKTIIHGGRGISKYDSNQKYNIPETRHLLEIDYNNQTIQIIYELGAHNMAKIKCELSNNTAIPIFAIKPKNHYQKLLNKNINILSIKSQHIQFQTLLQEKLNSLGIEQLARDNKFLPKIIIEKESQVQVLTISYYLGFPDKIKVIKPLVQLCQFFIDFSFGYIL